MSIQRTITVAAVGILLVLFGFALGELSNSIGAIMEHEREVCDIRVEGAIEDTISEIFLIIDDICYDRNSQNNPLQKL